MSRTRVIHQFHFSTAPADAVSNQMFYLRDCLREAGVGGEIFSVESRCPETEVKRFVPRAMEGADLLLVHHSHGNPSLDDVLREAPPKALVYHNITPSEFFTHDPYLARLSELGRSQLHALRRSVIASFADSEFNAFELETVGFPRGEILPLLDLTGHEKATHARLEAKAKQGGPLLFVGRIAPHKNQALLLKTYFYLKRAKRNVPKLVLVGGGDPLYREYLRLLAKTLKIEDDVELVGKISNEDLARRYAQAGVFVCVSRHEGFCIPLVEAMRARIPIVARPLTGVKETLGPAGLSLKTERPHRIAEILLGVLESREIRLAMLEGQEAQLERLVRRQRRELAQTLLLELLERVAPKGPRAPKETHVRPNAEPQLSL